MWKDYFRSLYNRVPSPIDSILPSLPCTLPSVFDCRALPQQRTLQGSSVGHCSPPRRIPSSTSGNRPLSTPENPIPPSDLQTLLFWRGRNGIPFRIRGAEIWFLRVYFCYGLSLSCLFLVDKFTYILCADRNCNLIKHLFNLYRWQ